MLSFAKGRLAPDAFSKVQSAVPGSEEMISSFESSGESSGAGLLGAVSGLAGNLLGGKAGEGADLLAMLSRAGLDHNQVMAFLPKALEMLRQYLPPEVSRKSQGAHPRRGRGFARHRGRIARVRCPVPAGERVGVAGATHRRIPSVAPTPARSSTLRASATTGSGRILGLSPSFSTSGLRPGTRRPITDIKGARAR